MSKTFYFVLNDLNVNINHIVSTGYEDNKTLWAGARLNIEEKVYTVRLVNGYVIYLDDERRIKDLERCLGIS